MIEIDHDKIDKSISVSIDHCVFIRNNSADFLKKTSEIAK